MKNDLFIIAAGKGSRLGGSLPKALVPISDGIPNISTMLRQAKGKFNRIFVVTNVDIQDDWSEYFSNTITNSYLKDEDFINSIYNIPIISGFGDGHAVMSGVAVAKKTLQILSTRQQKPFEDITSEIVICWGDVFIQYEETFTEILAKNLEMSTASGFVPAVKEKNPYVTLLVDASLRIQGADFAKYGEKHESGWHDQSIFRFKTRDLLEALSMCHTSLWKGGRYMTQGNELSTLFAFHYLFNIDNGAKVYETDYPTMSFNTTDEVKAIQEEINKK